MEKLLKKFFISISVLLLILIILFVGLISFVNPNRLKPYISAEVQRHTGRVMTMEGDISWTLFPYLGLKSGHLELSNRPGFPQETFLAVDHAILGIKLLPLLHKRIEFSAIDLDGLKLNLITNSKSQQNWSNGFVPAVTLVLPHAAENISTVISATKGFSFVVAIKKLSVSDSEINWIDEKNKHNGILENLQFNVEQVNVNNVFSLHFSADISSDLPKQRGHLNLNTTVNINKEHSLIALPDLTIDVHFKQNNQSIPLKFQANGLIDLNKNELVGKNIIINFADLILTGAMTVTDWPANIAMVSDFQIKPVNIKSWLQNIGELPSNLQVFNALTGEVRLNYNSNKANVKGQLFADKIMANKIQLTEVTVPFEFSEKKLTFSELSAKFYQGNINATTTIDFTNAIPIIISQGKLVNVQVDAFLKDSLKEHSSLTLRGLANIDTNMITQGLTSESILKHLNGVVHLTINKGSLVGLDIPYYIRLMRAAIKQSPSGANDTKNTSFDLLSATGIIQNGIITNNDLSITAADFSTKGVGSINISDKRITYQLQTQVKNVTPGKNDLSNLYGLAIPISLTGSLSQPKIVMDTASLLQSVMKLNIEAVRKDIKEQIKQRLPQLRQLFSH